MQPAPLHLQLPQGNGELVLIVDDDVSTRSAISASLMEFGYRVLVARDGVDTVEIFTSRAREVYAVISDLHRPFLEQVSLINLLQSMNPTVRIVDLNVQFEQQQAA